MFGVVLLAAGLGAFVIVVSGSGFGTLVLCFVFWMGCSLWGCRCCFLLVWLCAGLCVVSGGLVCDGWQL